MSRSLFRSHRAGPVLSVVLALSLAGCASANPGPTTTATQLAETSPSPSTVPTSPTAGSAATASPVATAVPSASRATSSPPASSETAPPIGSLPGCPVTRQTGLLPSDRLVDLAISSTTTHDLVTFVFAPSSPGPGGPPRGSLEAAAKPFSFAGSGQPIELRGQHAVQIRFSGMTIANESGAATYRGPASATPPLAALREAIQYDASEGIIGWYIGYDGRGCVSLVRDGNDVTVMIAHPEAPAG